MKINRNDSLLQLIATIIVTINSNNWLQQKSSVVTIDLTTIFICTFVNLLLINYILKLLKKMITCIINRWVAVSK